MNHGYGEMGSSRLFLVPGANLGVQGYGEAQRLAYYELAPRLHVIATPKIFAYQGVKGKTTRLFQVCSQETI